jgi:hypothetical protein
MADPAKSVRRPLSAFIEEHPLFVIASVAVGAFLLGGGAVSWVLFNGYVPNQLYTLQTKLDECRAHKSPDETIAGNAEDAVSDEWTPLSPQQIDSWANKLSPYHIKSITVSWSQAVDARRFFRSLQAVGKRLGCEVQAGLGRAGGHEIDIHVVKDDPAGAVLLDLFNSLNWPVKKTDLLPFPKELKELFGQEPPGIQKTGEVAIFIPQKF